MAETCATQSVDGIRVSRIEAVPGNGLAPTEVSLYMATMPELTERISNYEARTTALRDSL